MTTYVTKPNAHPLTKFARRNVAIIYLSDVFGIELLQNKLYAPLNPPRLERDRH